MKIKGIIFEDTINYKKISLTFMMPYCSFKCDKESGCKVCQNSEVVKLPIIDIPIDELIKRYDMFLLSKAVVLGGLEPLDSDDTHAFISAFRATHKDDIVIYTGYNKDDVVAKFRWIYDYPNIIIIDLICRSVSSPSYFQAYVKFHEDKHKSKLLSLKQKSVKVMIA